tara:strand:+ start:1510 stop:2136 length:627 start_codon:yes stop_codon:yes gene_type:complete
MAMDADNVGFHPFFKADYLDERAADVSMLAATDIFSPLLDQPGVVTLLDEAMEKKMHELHSSQIVNSLTRPMTPFEMVLLLAASQRYAWEMYLFESGKVYTALVRCQEHCNRLGVAMYERLPDFINAEYSEARERRFISAAAVHLSEGVKRGALLSYFAARQGAGNREALLTHQESLVQRTSIALAHVLKSVGVKEVNPPPFPECGLI